MTDLGSPDAFVLVHKCLGCFAGHLVREALEERRFDLALELLATLSRHVEHDPEVDAETRARVEKLRAEHLATIA